MTTEVSLTGAEPVVVRNLKQSLLQGGSSVAAEPAAAQNGTTPQKKTRVAVLISGTGEIFEMKKSFDLFLPSGNKF